MNYGQQGTAISRDMHHIRRSFNSSMIRPAYDRGALLITCAKGGKKKQGGGGGEYQRPPQPPPQQRLGPSGRGDGPGRGGRGKGGPSGGKGGGRQTLEEISAKEVKTLYSRIFTDVKKPPNLDDMEKGSVSDDQTEVTYAERPNTCSIGQKYPLETNFIDILPTNIQVAEYRLDVYFTAKNAPEVPREIKQAVYKELELQNGWKDAASDGTTIYFFNQQPPPIQLEEREFNIGGQQDTFKIEMKQTSAQPQKLQDMMQIENQAVQAERAMNLEIQTKLRDSANLSSEGTNFFDKKQQKVGDLDDGREAWSGFSGSVKRGQDGLFLNFETTVRPALKAGRVLDILSREVKDKKQLIKNTRFANNILAGVKVKDDLSTFSRVVKQISNKDSSYKFTDSNGKQVTIQQYYKQQYNYTIKYPKLNLLDCTRKNQKIQVLIPMEICYIKDTVVEKIKDNQVAKIIRYAAMKPNERKGQVIQAAQQVQNLKKSSIQNFQIKLKKVEGRRLEAPLLQFGIKGAAKFFKFMDSIKGSWEQPAQTPFHKPAQIRSYAIVDLTGDKYADMEKIVENIIKTGQKYGMNFSALPRSGNLVTFCDPRSFETDKELQKEVFDEAIQTAENVFNEKPTYIFVGLARQGSNPYKEVKRLTELDNQLDVNILTQCCKVSDRMNQAYFSNYILKTNAKNLGKDGFPGVNQTVVGNLIANILQQPQLSPIYFGIDVTYRSLEEEEVSLAAVVGLMDKYPFQYQARYLVTTGPSRQELRPDIKNPIKELLLEHKRWNGDKLPQSIFVYRDGVGDSMFEQVLATEYTCIKQACAEISSELKIDYSPPITFIIVQKRHNTRFFPVNPNDGDKNGNVKPGVAVDTGICSPINWDWYLTHHQTIQGTSKATKYVVLVDENRMSTEKLMLMTHWMTYTYSRAYKAVSVVPPAYYAHLAAEREAVLTPINAIQPPKVARNILERMHFI